MRRVRNVWNQQQIISTEFEELVRGLQNLLESTNNIEDNIMNNQKFDTIQVSIALFFVGTLLTATVQAMV